MVLDTDQSKICPEESASLISCFTFHWFSKLIHLGNKKTLEDEDLWDLSGKDTAECVIPPFKKNFDKEMKKSPKDEPSIFMAFLKTYKIQLFMGACLKLIFDMLQFLVPQLLKMLLNFIENETQPIWIGVTISLVMFLVSLTRSMLLHQYHHLIFRLMMRIRSTLSDAVYIKTLNLSGKSRNENTAGSIVNLISIDIQKIQENLPVLMVVWSAPIQIIVGIYFLWQLVGIAVLAGLFILIVVIPINALITSQMKQLQVKQMKYKDERIKLITEVLNGMKVLKFYAWEKSMEKMILEIREKELSVLERLCFWNAVIVFSWTCAPFLVYIISFTVYVFIDPENNILTPKIIFVALSLFDILRMPLSQIAMIYGGLIQCKVSNIRLKKFLAAEELSQNFYIMSHDEDDFAVKIENGNFSWCSEAIIHDVSLEIKKGQLVGIVGKIGSGKSSLLHALLGEMNKKSGSGQINGSIAYVPQTAWIQNMSLQDNILLNKPYDFNAYESVINNCALKEDLTNLPAGDATEIGEKGTNLSGGQKQRVSLARAVYQDCDIYLLDDPLSAVDAKVGKHIFENVFSSKTGCLGNKTIVLVTHNMKYLEECDQVIVMKDGNIGKMGTYEELKEMNEGFSEISEEFVVNNEQIISGGDKNSYQSSRNHITTKNHHEHKVTSTKTTLFGEKSQLIKKETLQNGHVKLETYLTYFHAISIPIILFFMLAYVASNFLGLMSSFFLARLSDLEISQNRTSENAKLHLEIYAALGIGQFVIVFLASIFLILGMMRASRILHENLLMNIMKSPVSFFDTIPIGRLLNRFGQDIESVDRTLPDVIRQMIMMVFSLVSTLLIILWAIPWIGVIFATLSVVYLYVLKLYINTSRQLKRLESASKSPVYSHFQDSIHGVSSIRAYNVTDEFIKKSQQKVDESIKTQFPCMVANRWLAIRLEMIGNLIVLSAAGAAVYFRDSPGLSAGLVGLSVTYALNITQNLSWAVRMTSELETNIVAVERINEYTNTPTERSNHISSPPASWPDKGEISFKNFSAKYRPGLELVLHEVNFHIMPGEKIGIVGRTGAGKSSLILALFRIFEADEGCIEIDGIDIADIQLEVLRSRLTIVPQDPVLFSGTLRINLDPFNVYNDDQIWKALKNAHLASFVESLPEGLQYLISDRGENLSVGQRQLICFARALLRKSKIMILDEAAASVDVETDKLIQETVRKQFKQCTVFTIAHRLNSVMDSDRVLVLDKGQLVELNSPERLLENSDGIFYSMARDGKI